MRYLKWWFSPILIVAGAAIIYIFLTQPVTVLLNGTPRQVSSFAVTTADILASAGIPLTNGDLVRPALNDWVLSNTPVTVDQASNYTIEVEQSTVAMINTDQHPANLLQDVGIRIFPGDQIIADGLPWPVQSALPYKTNHTVQIRRGQDQAADPSATSRTVGQALALRGLAPQGLDKLSSEAEPYSAGTEQIPERIVDQLEITQKSLPYNFVTQLDSNLEIDSSKVTQVGSYGLALQLNRTRYVNDTAGETRLESETIIKPPVDEITGVGTKTTIKTLDVGGTTIEYYRALSLYATSYSPCRSGTPECHSGTASGAPAAKGIVAVVSRWYPYMAGARVYIPGYGFAVVGDLGGGIPGKYWIDLAYSDDDFVSWHSYVTVYFLTPVPDNPLYVLN